MDFRAINFDNNSLTCFLTKLNQLLFHTSLCTFASQLLHDAFSYKSQIKISKMYSVSSIRLTWFHQFDNQVHSLFKASKFLENHVEEGQDDIHWIHEPIESGDDKLIEK